MGLVYKDVMITYSGTRVKERRPVAVCDTCRAEMLLGPMEPDPAGWVVFFDGPETLADADRHYACSWACLRTYANDRANAETPKVSV